MKHFFKQQKKLKLLYQHDKHSNETNEPTTTMLMDEKM